MGDLSAVSPIPDGLELGPGLAMFVGREDFMDSKEEESTPPSRVSDTPLPSAGSTLPGRAGFRASIWVDVAFELLEDGPRAVVLVVSYPLMTRPRYWNLSLWTVLGPQLYRHHPQRRQTSNTSSGTPRSADTRRPSSHRLRCEGWSDLLS